MFHAWLFKKCLQVNLFAMYTEKTDWMSTDLYLMRAMRVTGVYIYLWSVIDFIALNAHYE